MCERICLLFSPLVAEGSPEEDFLPYDMLGSASDQIRLSTCSASILSSNWVTSIILLATPRITEFYCPLTNPYILQDSSRRVADPLLLMRKLSQIMKIRYQCYLNDSVPRNIVSFNVAGKLQGVLTIMQSVYPIEQMHRVQIALLSQIRRVPAMWSSLHRVRIID